MDIVPLIFSVLPITEDHHQMLILSLTGLFAMSEALAHIPAVKENGIFQLIFGLLGRLVAKVK
jgi:hypothetical protein